MYASIHTLHIKPGEAERFVQQWGDFIEPSLNQLAGLMDLYLLFNADLHTALLVTIYASEADTNATQRSVPYQVLLEQLADLLCDETIVSIGYAVIST